MRISDRWTSVYPPWVGYEGLDDIPSQHKKQWYICISIYRCIYMYIYVNMSILESKRYPKLSKMIQKGTTRSQWTFQDTLGEQGRAKRSKKDAKRRTTVGPYFYQITSNHKKIASKKALKTQAWKYKKKYTKTMPKRMWKSLIFQLVGKTITFDSCWFYIWKTNDFIRKAPQIPTYSKTKLIHKHC